MKLLTCAVVLAYLSALSHTIKVKPISKNPTYAEPTIPLRGAKKKPLMCQRMSMVIRIKINPKQKLINNFTTRSCLSLRLKIQKSAQITALLSGRRSPLMLEKLSPAISPRVAMMMTPAKLMMIAIMLIKLIFCLRSGIESSTSIRGQV